MKKILLCLLLLHGLSTCFAQQSQLKFEHFTVREGLPERVVLLVKQDDLGYIWMGTQNGLLRYNGYEPKVYKPAMHANQLYSSFSVRSLTLDKYKTIWVSTVGNGLFRYNRLKDDFTQFDYPQKLGKNDVYQHIIQAADNKGYLWMLSYDISNHAEVFRFNTVNGKFEAFSKDRQGTHNLNAGNPKTIYAGLDGRIWLGTDKGLYVFGKDNAFHASSVSADTALQTTVRLIYEAPSEPGILWMNVLDHHQNTYHIVRFDTQHESAKNYVPDAPTATRINSDTVYDVYEDTHQQLWFASANGLLHFNRTTEQLTSLHPADSSQGKGRDKLYGIAEAKNGALWLTGSKGLFTFNPQAKQFQWNVSNPDDPAALSGNYVNDLLIDSSGVVWACVINSGVDKLNTLTSLFSTQKQKAKESFSCEKIGEVALKNKARPVTIYQVLA